MGRTSLYPCHSIPRGGARGDSIRLRTSQPTLRSGRSMGFEESEQPRRRRRCRPRADIATYGTPSRQRGLPLSSVAGWSS